MTCPNEPLIELTATHAAKLLQAGDLTAAAYAEALIAQAQKTAALNAFIGFDAEAVRAHARAADQRRQAGEPLGPLHGVPLAIKDNIDTDDLPTTAGTPGLRHHRPRKNAVVVQRLLDAGAILFGKNNMHELAYGVTTNNRAFGPSRNPYEPQRVPGGSSGGTAAAVCARVVPAGIGTDTGASVRLPMAFCGGVGFRPSIGRWPQHGLVPASHTRDTAGPMARSVADCMLLDGVVTGGPMQCDPVSLENLRLGLPRDYFWEDIDDEASRVLEAALARLRNAGVVIVEGGTLPGLGTLDMEAGFAIAGYEMPRELGHYLSSQSPAIELRDVIEAVADGGIKAILQSLIAAPVSEEAYRHGMSRRAQLHETYRRYFADMRIDALLMPTSPLLAPLIGQDDSIVLNGREVPLLHTAIRSTNPGSVIGIPGLSLPAGQSAKGLPIGLGIDAPHGEDARLLAIGAAIEAALPRLPPPPISEVRRTRTVQNSNP